MISVYIAYRGHRWMISVSLAYLRLFAYLEGIIRWSTPGLHLMSTSTSHGDVQTRKILFMDKLQVVMVILVLRLLQKKCTECAFKFQDWRQWEALHNQHRYHTRTHDMNLRNSLLICLIDIRIYMYYRLAYRLKISTSLNCMWMSIAVHNYRRLSHRSPN